MNFNSLENDLNHFLQEDGLDRMLHLQAKLPQKIVKTKIHWKSNLRVAGMPCLVWLLSKYLKDEILVKQKDCLLGLEGKDVVAGSITEIELPYSAFISLERVALNLLHRLSAVATTTSSYVEKAQPHGIAILDTRKTTPGLRSLERYAVKLGGGVNHRNDLSDILMIKDNHKVFFGGVGQALDFFKAEAGFYQPIIVEIHHLDELRIGIAKGVKHFMLDNFSIEQIKQAVALKIAGITYEVSGGVNIDNIEKYLIPGVDAISLSSITFWPAKVDLSWKIAT